MDIKNFDFLKLSQDELKELAANVLSLIKNPEQGIGTKLFDAIIKITPQTCIEAIVVDNIDKPNKILVTWRDDEHYHGWHFPGGYIRFGKDSKETIQDVIKRELNTGIKKSENSGLIYSITDDRGHTIGIVFLVELNDNPNTGRWFDYIPLDLLSHHKKILKEALGWK